MRSAPSQRFISTGRSALWVHAPPSTLSLPKQRLAPGVFRPAVLLSIKIERVIRSQGSLLFRAYQLSPTSLPHNGFRFACDSTDCTEVQSQHHSVVCSPDNASRGVSSPTALSVPGVLFTVGCCQLTGQKIASPLTFPPSGFLTLLTGYSSWYLASLFRLTSTHGVHPSETSPPAQPCRLPATIAFLSFSQAAFPLPDRRLQGFALRESPLATRSVSTAWEPRFSPGLLPSRAFSLLTVALPSQRFLSSFETSRRPETSL